MYLFLLFFFSSRRRHTRSKRDWSSDVCSADLKWRVLFFRDQELSNDALKAFGREFGPLTPAHPIQEGLDAHPEIWERKIEEYRTRRTDAETRPPSARPPVDYKGWHIDITFVANPNRYSILYGVEIPPYGGDTIFTSLIAAYEGADRPAAGGAPDLHLRRRQSQAAQGRPRHRAVRVAASAGAHPPGN